MAQTTISSYGQEQKAQDKAAKKGKITSQSPFRCCSETTRKAEKKMAYKGIEYNYEVWRCNACNKEYLSPDQAGKMERFLMVEKLLDDRLVSLKRKMNFDGKAFFFRFPKELTGSWNRESNAEIRIIGPESFLVEIKPNI
ncbi:hypothetical protein HYU10_03855 [Candidatus Woesearchaeota archaeon]|nr:hypothetical protein [Candidatus Woesearchaeota archaeon]MBI2661654.1 hypothetical protein [Candidatus Woesearchaeota archaeon]